MKQIFLAGLIITVCSFRLIAQEDKPEVKLETTLEQISYFLGLDVGNQFKPLHADFKLDVFTKGFLDVQNGNPPEIPAHKLQTLLVEFKKLKEAGQDIPDTLANGETLSFKDQLSYLFGSNIANQIKTLNIKLDADKFVLGVQHTLSDTPSLLSEETKKLVVQEFQKMVKAGKEQMLTENKAKGKAFLTENATKEGVKTTPSGLQYLVMNEGKGAKPGPTNKVKVHYEGTLIDGTVFDSSYKRGEPISFPLNGVIKGWTEGVQLMSIGSKYKFFIPSDLAYGDRGTPGGPISGGATLIFVVELLGIEGK